MGEMNSWQKSIKTVIKYLPGPGIPVNPLPGELNMPKKRRPPSRTSVKKQRSLTPGTNTELNTQIRKMLIQHYHAKYRVK
jgi:hypothetical protein